MRVMFFKNLKYIRIAFAAIVVTLVIFTARWILSEYYTIQTLDLPNDSKLIISAASFWEISQDLYYQIDDGNGRTDRKLLGFADDGAKQLKFQTVMADKKSIVGLVEEYRPDVLVVVLDLKTKRSQEEMARVLNNETGENYVLHADFSYGAKVPPRVWP